MTAIRLELTTRKQQEDIGQHRPNQRCNYHWGHCHVLWMTDTRKHRHVHATMPWYINIYRKYFFSGMTRWAHSGYPLLISTTAGLYCSLFLIAYSFTTEKKKGCSVVHTYILHIQWVTSSVLKTFPVPHSPPQLQVHELWPTSTLKIWYHPQIQHSMPELTGYLTA